MILFRRHRIIGPEVFIPPEFERGEIEDAEGTDKVWHGFMPVYEVEGVLEDAMHELRRLQDARRIEPWDEFEIGRVADRIERLLDSWEAIDAAERA